MSKNHKKNFFIDDEAELSEEDLGTVSEDEIELSDDDVDDENLVAKGEEAEVDSEEDEKVRNFFHKQLENEDRRQVLILKEQLEDRDIGLGQRRRKKFRWQTATLLDRFNKDEAESDDGEDDGITDEDIANMSAPRLRRPTTKFISLGTATIEASNSNSSSAITRASASTSTAISNNDTRSQTSSTATTANINKYLYRDRETVAALSKEQAYIGPPTKEEREKVVQRELKKVLQSKSIFDALLGQE